VVSGVGGRYNLICGLVMIAVVMPVTIMFVAVPFMRMVDTAVVAFPVALKPLTTFVPWRDPMRSCVWCTSPISLMPDVAIVDRIPVAIHPGVIRSGRHRTHPDHTGRRRRTNPNSNGNLRKCRSGQQEQ